MQGMQWTKNHPTKELKGWNTDWHLNKLWRQRLHSWHQKITNSFQSKPCLITCQPTSCTQSCKGKQASTFFRDFWVLSSLMGNSSGKSVEGQAKETGKNRNLTLGVSQKLCSTAWQSSPQPRWPPDFILYKGLLASNLSSHWYIACKQCSLSVAALLKSCCNRHNTVPVTPLLWSPPLLVIWSLVSTPTNLSPSLKKSDPTLGTFLLVPDDIVLATLQFSEPNCNNHRQNKFKSTAFKMYH